MALVVAQFHYSFPALADQLSSDDLHKVDVVFNKARRGQLPVNILISADLIEHLNIYSEQPSIPLTLCIICYSKEEYVWTQFEEEESWTGVAFGKN